MNAFVAIFTLLFSIHSTHGFALTTHDAHKSLTSDVSKSKRYFSSSMLRVMHKIPDTVIVSPFSFSSRVHFRREKSKRYSTAIFSSVLQTIDHGFGDDTEISSSNAPIMYEAELIVKKSQFISYACHCPSWPDAQKFLVNIKSIHPKARHVCYGFVGGGGGTSTATERSSDGGEPTGTAGPVILGAIKGESLSDTVVAVVRYFGGIKLGAGGLIRAYGGAARDVLRLSPTLILIPKTLITLRVPASNIGNVYEVVNRFAGITEGESYDDQGQLEISVSCKLEDSKSIRQALRDSTRGNVFFIEEGESSD
mmetsp:Transcript_39597/g.77427  ORF Transcript_39597/g.77427 Transcript_39597/m.77427 type:complete len:309 (-) Transcript_39597:116-1042(-)